MAKTKKDAGKTSPAEKPSESDIPVNRNQPMSEADRLNLQWGPHKFDEDWNDIKTAMVEFAEMSRRQYLSMPKAFPKNFQSALRTLLLSDPGSLSKDRQDLRGDIIKRLAHYLKNQFAHTLDSDVQSAEFWSGARQVIKTAQYESATRSFERVVFSESLADRLITLANAAAEKHQLNQHLILTPPLSRGKKKSTIEEKVSSFAKDHSLTLPQREAYRCSLLQKPIKIGKPASNAGVSICDQKRGILQYKGKEKLKISPTATAMWTVIRLLVESPTEKVNLFPGWCGSFGRISYKKHIELLGKKGRKPTGEVPQYLCRLRKLG